MSTDQKILIVIDLQKGFVTEHSKPVVDPIKRALRQFDRVIFTKFINPDDSPFRRILDYQKLSEGSEETELVMEVAPDAVIIERPHYTCVTEELREQLEQMKAESVYICGIATEACVLKTVLDLFEHDIRPIVIKDWCASDQEQKYHDMAIELIEKAIKKENVISSADLAKKIAA